MNTKRHRIYLDNAVAMDAPGAYISARDVPDYTARWLQETYNRYRAQALTPDEALRKTASYCAENMATVQAYVEAV